MSRGVHHSESLALFYCAPANKQTQELANEPVSCRNDTWTLETVRKNSREHRMRELAVTFSGNHSTYALRLTLTRGADGPMCQDHVEQSLSPVALSQIVFRGVLHDTPRGALRSSCVSALALFPLHNETGDAKSPRAGGAVLAATLSCAPSPIRLLSVAARSLRSRPDPRSSRLHAPLGA